MSNISESIKDENGSESKGTEPFSLDLLYNIIIDRKNNRKPGSYTTYLFDKGIDTILKKIGEESTEVVIAGKGNIKAEAIYEIADLTYHTMVLMAQMGITTEEIILELAGRHADKGEELPADPVTDV